MKITILGSGTSQGVPVISCDCRACTSTDSRDKRLRASIMISHNGENFVIDSGPDFRQQMLRENVKTLSGIIFTHEHKDHVAGLDDVRAFNFFEKRDMPVYCTEQVEKALRNEFHYIFADNKYPGVPSIKLNRISKSTPFEIANGLRLVPIEVMHYRMPVLGYRIGDFTYITDAKTISEEEKQKIKGTKVLVVNALREKEHISHFNLEQALAFIVEIAPEKAYLTHISHLFDTHEEIERKLPSGVEVAWDGMVLEV
ncbi:MAG TPA: MBL fold metallo-hydrolase [Crocinitomicaceae bacterium]|nr:MBL fold metallo-hydrolase [Crocinitomicaceae bacterium]